jgi:CBS-domain-containing membrane protein
MFVKSIMIPKHHCITADPKETLRSALKKLENHQIDGMPIVDGDSYGGMVTRYHIYESYFLSNKQKVEFLDSTFVQDIATHQEKFLNEDEVFEKTLLELKDFPLLAVVDEKQRMIGIMTRADVLEQFESAFGVNRPGVRIAFTSVETEGRIARLSDIAHQFQAHIISLVTFDETDKLVRRIVMKIEKKSNVDRFTKKLEEHGFRVLSVKED